MGPGYRGASQSFVGSQSKNLARRWSFAPRRPPAGREVPPSRVPTVSSADTGSDQLRSSQPCALRCGAVLLLARSTRLPLSRPRGEDPYIRRGLARSDPGSRRSVGVCDGFVAVADQPGGAVGFERVDGRHLGAEMGGSRRTSRGQTCPRDDRGRYGPGVDPLNGCHTLTLRGVSASREQVPGLSRLPKQYESRRLVRAGGVVVRPRPLLSFGPQDSSPGLLRQVCSGWRVEIGPGEVARALPRRRSVGGSIEGGWIDRGWVDRSSRSSSRSTRSRTSICSSRSAWSIGR